MFRKTLNPLAILTALAFALALGSPAQAQGTPGTTFADAEPVSATSIRVFWADDPQAEGYRVYRSGSGAIAEVAENVNEYLDTGLTPGVPCYYGIASLVGGEEYWMHHPDFGSMPLDAPAAITSLTLHKVPDGAGFRMDVFIIWAPVSLSSGYEVYARVGDSGEYSHYQNAAAPSAMVSFPMPEEKTSYWFKVRIFYDGYYVPEYGYYMHRTGPFSPEASVTWYPSSLLRPIVDLYQPVRVWPWEDPRHEGWLKGILEAYADPAQWPENTAVDTGLLASLAGKLAKGEALSKQERAVAGAIHPHGLALLAGAWLAPPSEEQARSLTARLDGLKGLLAGGLPEALEGGVLVEYRQALSETCELISLKLETATDNGSLFPHLKIILPGSGENPLNSLPDQTLTRTRATPPPPTPTPLPLRQLRTAAPIQRMTLQPILTPGPLLPLPGQFLTRP